MQSLVNALPKLLPEFRFSTLRVDAENDGKLLVPEGVDVESAQGAHPERLLRYLSTHFHKIGRAHV